MSVKEASAEVRKGFVRKVYGILCVQLLVTTAVAAPIARMSPPELDKIYWISPLATAVVLLTVLSMCCCQDMLRTYPTNYIILFGFTAAEGALVGFFCSFYTAQSVVWAFGLTAFIFLWMTGYAWTTKSDFTGAGPYLYAAFSVAIMVSILISIAAFFGVNVQTAQTAYAAFGILLFTCYIVYDTQLMLGELGGHKIAFSIDEYAYAALSLYVDIGGLFVDILQVFGNRT